MAKIPSSELAPRGNDNVLERSPRGFNWLDNFPRYGTMDRTAGQQPHQNKMDFHDAAYTLAAPFWIAKELVKTAERMWRITGM